MNDKGITGVLKGCYKRNTGWYRIINLSLDEEALFKVLLAVLRTVYYEKRDIK